MGSRLMGTKDAIVLWIERLTALERRAVEPVLAIDSDQFSVGSPVFVMENGFLKASFHHYADECVPFEVYFGRDQYTGLFNVFVGIGAEFCSLEPLSSLDDADGLASDLRKLLESPVECEQELVDGRVYRAAYQFTSFDVGGTPLRIVGYAGKKKLFSRRRQALREYRPWCVAAPIPR